MNIILVQTSFLTLPQKSILSIQNQGHIGDRQHTYMRTCSEAHLPLYQSSMSSEPIPIAHISEEVNIEEDPPSEEPQEVKDENEPKVQAKSSIVPVDDLVSTLLYF